MSSKTVQQRRLGRHICVFCLHGFVKSHAKQPLVWRSRFSTGSCLNAPSPEAIRDKNQPGPPQPKKFGGFADRLQRDHEKDPDAGIDWGDVKERAAFASSAPPLVKAPRLDAPLREPTQQRAEKDVEKPANQAPRFRIKYSSQPRFEGRSDKHPARRPPQREDPLDVRSGGQSSSAAQAAGQRSGPREDVIVDISRRQPPRHQKERRATQAEDVADVGQRTGPRKDVVVDVSQQRDSSNTVPDEDRDPPTRPEHSSMSEQKRGKQRKGERRSQKFANVKEEDDDEFFDPDMEEKLEERRERKRQKKAARRADQDLARSTIALPPFISVQSLATVLKARPEDFVKKLQELGFDDVAMDHVLNGENAGLVAMEYGFEPFIDRSESEDVKAQPLPEDMSAFPLRPPIVTIMGHVDHGKTTLLDFLRQSSVAASEHGGITQHIGAFSVPIASADNRMVTFLDTPGHAAFLTMRQRGAKVTDIVVLVVAADDSVKPQTIEAIRHAKAAGVQIIVAISKIDKESADPQRVKSDLIQHDIEVEDFGGSIQAIEVSGKTGQGVADLEEAIITLADVLDMRADHDGAPEGWVLEASTKKSGRAATVLVRRGTLRTGDVIVAGTTWARVRSLFNEAGVRIDEASPGMPVEVEGWREQPAAGDEVLGVPSEGKANDVVSFRASREARVRASADVDAVNESRRIEAERHAAEKTAADEAADRVRATLRTNVRGRHKSIVEASRAAREEAGRAFVDAAHDDTRRLYVVVKADVGGSAEAVVGGIASLPLARHAFAVDVLRAGVGHVSENDVAYAAAAPAGAGFIVNFNQDLPPAMAGLAERSGVRVLDSSIIYRVIDDVRAAVEERLPPVVSTRVLGEADALQAFELRGAGGAVTRIAGCRVKNGTVGRNDRVRVFRGGVGAGEVVFDGRLASLKNVKKDVMEMRKGTECGIAFDGWSAFEQGDVIQCYEEKRETRRLV